MGKFDNINIKNNYNKESSVSSKETNIAPPKEEDNASSLKKESVITIPKKNPRKPLNTSIKSEHLEFIEDLEYELRAKKSDIMDYIIDFFMQNTKYKK